MIYSHLMPCGVAARDEINLTTIYPREPEPRYLAVVGFRAT